MPPVDWKDAWERGSTPWDEGRSPPSLYKLESDGRIPAGRILVPGCGTGYDLATLARADREVVGLDLSPLAKEAFFAAHPELPGRVRYVVGDFFSYTPAEPFDFAWDYTFFCALDPEQREAWAATTARLVRHGGMLATLLFPYADPIVEREGPPWPINTAMVEDLLTNTFERLEVIDAHATHPGREGKEKLVLWRRRGAANG